MRMMRRLFVLTCLLTVGLLIWAGVYARKHGFTASWRSAIESELAAQGYHVDIGKLTLGAFRGLVAEDVQFYTDKERTEMFAEVNDIFLDVNLDRVFQKKISINSLDIQNGRLSIPLQSPLAPDGKDTLYIQNLSARIALTESRVEVVRMEANLAGLNVSIKGSLLRPPNQRKSISDSGRKVARASISVIQSLHQIVRVLDQFQFPHENPPELDIDFRGDLRDLTSTTATTELSSGAFRKKRSDYRIAELNLSAEYDGQAAQLKIPRLQLQDASGVFDAEGIWEQEPNELSFDVSSTVDLPHLLHFFFPNRKWGEVVFFQPPAIQAKGLLRLDDVGTEINTKKPFFPGRILGEFSTERFVTSGIVFNSSRGDFSMDGHHFYLRNFRADHKTGVAFLNCKFEPDQGRESFQFQSEIKLDPRIFGPFLKDAETRTFLENWHFSENSGVYLAAAGQSSDIELTNLRAKGVIDLRDFRLKRIPFTELEADFEVDGSQRWYRNLRLTRDDGKMEAELAHLDTLTRQWNIKGGVSTVNPADAFGLFSPRLKELLADFRFDSPPVIKIQGTIDGRPQEDISNQVRNNKLDISFSSEGLAHAPLFGEEFPFLAPNGTIHLSKNHLHIRSLKAGLCGGNINIEYDTPNLWESSRPFSASLAVQGVGLAELHRLCRRESDASGSLAGSLHFSGKGGLIQSFNGRGEVRVPNDDLSHIIVLNGLENWLNEAEAPLEAKAEGLAQASFTIEKGVFASRKLNLSPRGVALKGTAQLDFPGQNIQAELHTTKPRNGKNWTLHCEGDLAKPKWISRSQPAIVTPKPKTTFQPNPQRNTLTSSLKKPWIKLFNGQDLSGWHTQSEKWIHGSGGRWGATAEGALFGEQDPPGSGNGGLLLSDEKFSEFELEFSLRPDWGPCSGVFLRANERGEGWQVYVDYHDNGNVGHLRLETKKHSVPFRPFSFFRIDPGKPALRAAPDQRTDDWPGGVYEESCTAEEFLAAWKPDDWNRMRIRCTGAGHFPVVEVWINDLKICRLNTAATPHPKLEREKAAELVNLAGSIGFQVHGGKGWPKGARVFWKDIRIRRLDAGAQDLKASRPANSSPGNDLVKQTGE